jgi:hypothetical protein
MARITRPQRGLTREKNASRCARPVVAGVVVISLSPKNWPTGIRADRPLFSVVGGDGETLPKISDQSLEVVDLRLQLVPLINQVSQIPVDGAEFVPQRFDFVGKR